MAPLCEVFVDALPAEQRDRFRGHEGLEGALEALFAAGASSWPDLVVSRDAFTRQLGAKIPADLATPPSEVLASVRPADLILACACAAGDARAIAALETSYFGEVDAAVRRMRASDDVVDEARQVLRSEILVPKDGRPAGIAGFSGRGELRSWIRVAAIRQVVRILRGTKKHAEFEDDALYEVVAPADDPEIEHIKRLYREEFAAAFRQAIRSLTPRERTVLRHQTIDGLSIDDIGAIYGVHRATAARWIGKAREALLAGTREALMARLRIGGTEVDSIMRLVQSRLDLSLGNLLAISKS